MNAIAMLTTCGHAQQARVGDYSCQDQTIAWVEVWLDTGDGRRSMLSLKVDAPTRESHE